MSRQKGQDGTDWDPLEEKWRKPSILLAFSCADRRLLATEEEYRRRIAAWAMQGQGREQALA